MTTNPVATLRMLITYAICIPVAILLGYMLTDIGNNPTYSNLLITGVILGFIFLPILLRWHYPIMIAVLMCPVTLFFLKGNPSIGQVMIVLSLGVAIVERATGNRRHFINTPGMTWALVYTVAMVVMTMSLTGGIGLHSLGGEEGGGKKYILLFISVAAFFAMTSRVIPKEKRKLYIALFLLAGLPAFLGDLSLWLPAPLNYIGMFIRPTASAKDGAIEIGVTRLGAFAATAGVIANFMLAKYGLRGILGQGNALWRLPLFLLVLVLSLLGGFRLIFLTYATMCCLIFFMEGLHKTRLLPLFIFLGIISVSLIVPFANKMPYTFQRALSVVPGLDVSQAARDDAAGSSEWRLRIWREMWPRVPQYLWLGKGYLLTAEDYELMGRDSMFAGASRTDASQEGLAVSGDYHNGPLSTLIPFGIWGAISVIWIGAAGLRIMYRNFKYGDPELRQVNTYLFAMCIWIAIRFLFIFGGYGEDMLTFSVFTGFSLALNGGMCGPQPRLRPEVVPQAQPLSQPLPQARPQLA